MPNAHILIVDDEPDIRESVRDILEDEGYSVATAEGASQAQTALQARKADLVLLDVWMPEMDGLGLLRHWHAHGGLPAPVVMMSGHGTLETAVEAIRLGAYDFIEKPLSLDKLLLMVENALQTQRLAQENARLKRESRALFEPVGDSAYMQSIKAQARRLAEPDGWVLISGEPGVGKQTFARFIHGLGHRRHQPFIEVNLATLNTRQGAAVELFGSEEGGRVRYGLLEQAHGGTLFLAEVADLDKGVQTQLLSALESQSFVRVGGSEPVHVDVRVIAATARDLAEEVRAGRFREDLYYHLNVLPLRIAPLRDHAEDIPQLLEYELRRAQEQEGAPVRRLEADALALLTTYTWPGNVRELKNVIQRLLILAPGESIGLAEARQALGGQGGRAAGGVDDAVVREHGGRLAVEVELVQPLRDARDAFERAYLEAQLRLSQGSMTELARRTGMERTNLYRKLKALGVKDTSSRDESDKDW